MKARWTKWQGGHGAVHAYGFELGNLLRAMVQKRLDTGKWRVTINMADYGDHESEEEAFRRANDSIREYARDFIEDWTIWTASQRIPQRMPKGW